MACLRRLIASKNGSPGTDRKRTTVSTANLGYHALWSNFSMEKVGASTEKAHTCQKVDESANIDAYLSITTVIVQPSLLRRLIWLDKHLAETAV